MALDIKLHTIDHDSIISFNDLELIDNSYEISQSVKIRLLTILGEWFDDNRLGVPWLTDMTSTLVPMIVKRHIVREIIINTESIKDVTEIQIEELEDGIAKLTFTAVTTDNVTFTSEVNA